MMWLFVRFVWVAQAAGFPVTNAAIFFLLGVIAMDLVFDTGGA
jgi:hypothetical protein